MTSGHCLSIVFGLIWCIVDGARPEQEMSHETRLFALQVPHTKGLEAGWNDHASEKDVEPEWKKHHEWTESTDRLKAKEEHLKPATRANPSLNSAEGNETLLNFPRTVGLYYMGMEPPRQALKDAIGQMSDDVLNLDAAVDATHKSFDKHNTHVHHFNDELKALDPQLEGLDVVKKQFSDMEPGRIEAFDHIPWTEYSDDGAVIRAIDHHKEIWNDDRDGGRGADKGRNIAPSVHHSLKEPSLIQIHSSGTGEVATKVANLAKMHNGKEQPANVDHSKEEPAKVDDHEDQRVKIEALRERIRLLKKGVAANTDHHQDHKTEKAAKAASGDPDGEDDEGGDHEEEHEGEHEEEKEGEHEEEKEGEHEEEKEGEHSDEPGDKHSGLTPAAKVALGTASLPGENGNGDWSHLDKEELIKAAGDLVPEEKRGEAEALWKALPEAQLRQWMPKYFKNIHAEADMKKYKASLEASDMMDDTGQNLAANAAKTMKSLVNVHKKMEGWHNTVKTSIRDIDKVQATVDIFKKQVVDHLKDDNKLRLSNFNALVGDDRIKKFAVTLSVEPEKLKPRPHSGVAMSPTELFDEAPFDEDGPESRDSLQDEDPLGNGDDDDDPSHGDAENTEEMDMAMPGHEDTSHGAGHGYVENTKAMDEAMPGHKDEADNTKAEDMAMSGHEDENAPASARVHGGPKEGDASLDSFDQIVDNTADYNKNLVAGKLGKYDEVAVESSEPDDAQLVPPEHQD